MTRHFNVAWIDLTNAIIIRAKSLWKKVGFDCLNCENHYNPRFKLYTMGKTSKKDEEAIANAA
jgi:hypothetical protein